jgi:hypothetical protein
MKQKISLKNINTINNGKIFITSNLAWIITTIIGTVKMHNIISKNYEYHFLKGDYSPDSDSISIPIIRETFYVFIIYLIFQLFLNLFIYLTSLKNKLPTKLFIKADFYNFPVIIWELYFAFWITTTLIFSFYQFWIEFYLEGAVALFYTFILLNLRAGQIGKYKHKIE